MVNKMMLKMLAEFLGTSPEELNAMMQGGYSAVLEAVELMRQYDKRIARIEKHLGIVEETEPVIIDISLPLFGTSNTNGKVNENVETS